MAVAFHQSLSDGRWQTLTLAEQMGNIGSEVHRAIRWHATQNQASWEKAFDRALELFDLTIADQRWRSGMSELTRSREVFCSLFYDSNSITVSPENLQKYFDQFAVAARLKH